MTCKSVRAFWGVSFLLICLLTSLKLFAGAPQLMPPHPNLPLATLAMMRQKDAENHRLLRSMKNPMRNIGKNQSFNDAGAGKILQLVSGTKYVPTILARYPDQANIYTTTEFQNLIYTQNGIPTGSARDFFYQNSYGQMTLAGQTSSNWHTSTNNRVYYGYNMGFTRAALFAREAAQRADAAGFDWTSYDNDHDGYVDTLWVVHSGLGMEESSNGKDIWSHSWDFSLAGLGAFTTATDDPYHPGQKIKIDSYIIMPEQSYWAGGNGLTKTIVGIGVFCHEFGHALGLPDLYDTGSSGGGQGLGFFSLMAGGSWGGNGNDSRYPANLDCWSKADLGWVTPTTVTTNGNYTIDYIEDNQSCYLLKPSDSIANQYFLVENRKKTGFDTTLPAFGLLIYHIDTDIINAYRDGNTINNNTHAYGIALEEADVSVDSYSSMHLFTGSNPGSSGDSWPTVTKTSFSGSSIPSTKTNSGASQYCGITNMPAKADSMTVNIYVMPTLLPPSITDFSPRLGAAGDGVVINGSGFTGATDVKFSDTSADSFTVDSDSIISAIVPVGAKTGTISVTTGWGTGVSADSFVVDAAPVAYDGVLTVLTGNMQSGQLSATDADDTVLTFSIVSDPTKGTVNIIDAATGEYSYTANAGAFGVDSFTFKATDPHNADSNISTVTVTVDKPLSGVSLSGDPLSPVLVDTSMTLTATPDGGQSPEYQFWVRVPGSPAKSLLQDYNSSNICLWTPTVPGQYTLLVYAREQGSSAAYQVYKTLQFYVGISLSGVSLSGKPLSPVKTGAIITLTATPAGGLAPEYQFWLQNSGSSGFILLRDYGTSKSCSWTPTSEGWYTIMVYVREQGSTETFQFSNTLLYEAKPPLSAVDLAGNPASPTEINIKVNLLATPIGGVQPEYQFWIRIPGSPAKSLLRDYALSNACSFTPAVAGTYTLLVYVRDKGSLAPYQVYKAIVYNVVNNPITAVTLTGDPVSPVSNGTEVILTATPTGGIIPEYQFWIRIPGSPAKTLLQDYSTVNTCLWTPNIAGQTVLLVYAREHGSQAPYQKYQTLVYQVQ